MTSWKPLTLLAVMLFTGITHGAEPDPGHIDVFLVDGQSVTNPGDRSVRVHAVDGPDRFEARLSQDLPTDRTQAERIARQRIEALNQDQVRRELEAAYTGPLLARQFGITRVPAIVFDEGQAVVYGETDIERALAHYRRWTHE